MEAGVVLLTLGLVLLTGSAFAAFVWAARDGQFEDLERGARVIFEEDEGGDFSSDGHGGQGGGREGAGKGEKGKRGSGKPGGSNESFSPEGHGGRGGGRGDAGKEEGRKRETRRTGNSHGGFARPRAGEAGGGFFFRKLRDVRLNLPVPSRLEGDGRA